METPAQTRSVPLFREKAHAMAEVALEDLYERVIDPETPLKTKQEFVELCTKLADLHPKQNQQQVQGTGFRISILLGDDTEPNPTSKIIDVTPEPDPATTTAKDTAGTLPETPAHLAIPLLTALAPTLNSALQLPDGYDTDYADDN